MVQVRTPSEVQVPLAPWTGVDRQSRPTWHCDDSVQVAPGGNSVIAPAMIAQVPDVPQTTQLKSFLPFAGSTRAPQSLSVAQAAVQVIEADGVQAPVGPISREARHWVPLWH